MTTNGDAQQPTEPAKSGKLKTPIGILMALLIALVPGAVVTGAIYAIKSGVFMLKRDRVLVFEGAGKGMSESRTPSFNVEHDWNLEIELTGSFASVVLTKLDRTEGMGGGDGYYDTHLFDARKPASRITQSITFGGEYSIEFIGVGKWKATIRQEAHGK